jgi:hypothetical protein
MIGAPDLARRAVVSKRLGHSARRHQASARRARYHDNGSNRQVRLEY